MNSSIQLMLARLQKRHEENAYRSLKVTEGMADFCSNDYLGLSRSTLLNLVIKTTISCNTLSVLGSTGSRLLSGNSGYAERLEQDIALYHEAESGLIFNSGYDANLSLFSSLPRKGDTVLMDEYIHASVIDGARLSFAHRMKFRHNDLEDLEKKLKRARGICYVAIESVYSMDGDISDIVGIGQLCARYGANLIVDEAHAFGVLGMGLVCELEAIDLVFARVVTFSKALGLQGGIVLGPKLLKDYLVNFARPFIYSTALSLHSLVSIRLAYDHLLENTDLVAQLAEKSILWVQHMPPQSMLQSSQNPTAIQCVFVNNNSKAIAYSKYLQERGFDVRPILSPTVPKGTERLRISLHIHNTDREIQNLCRVFHQLVNDFSPVQ